MNLVKYMNDVLVQPSCEGLSKLHQSFELWESTSGLHLDSTYTPTLTNYGCPPTLEHISDQNDTSLSESSWAPVSDSSDDQDDSLVLSMVIEAQRDMDVADKSAREPNGPLGLPIELFLAILRYTLASFWYATIDDHAYGRDSLPQCSFYGQLCKLRLVCTAWDAMINASCELWTLADGRSSNIDECLAKSKTAPLTVLLNSHSRGSWGRLTEVMSRWRRADFVRATAGFVDASRTTGFVDLSELEARPASILRSFRMSFRPQTDSLVLNLFQGVAPCLRLLHLEGVAPRS